jgi:molybdopterin-containing oxidoreductase family iron-sulfur binding subunit
MQLMSVDIDPAPGGIRRTSLEVTVERLAKAFPVANTDGSFFLEGRKDIVQTTGLDEFRKAVEAGHEPELDTPLGEGYKREKDIYAPHYYPDYRWCMVVDMDRCIGCGACVVACYAENNVPFVGREQMLKGREMSWIRVQRYCRADASKAWWLIMLCQHCSAAPCESVCPVFAPQHDPEGLNNQIYNRCFGTRFCSQNDPYKVRRFNWYTFTDYPPPLNMQFNPDVTVRQKGIMEKCSFCVQRIQQAKIDAKAAGRKVQDDDFTTACAQTCPTNALIFDNLKNPDSRVSKLIRNPRAYQVLKHLNTKPAAIYLKRVTIEV